MKIVMLADECDATSVVYNRLSKEYEDVSIIIEDGVSRKTLLKRRIKKLGLGTVIGQVCFMVLAMPFLRKESKDRVQEIIEKYHLDLTPSYQGLETTHKVSSVNDQECRDLLIGMNPDLIVVNGTRIISKATIECVEVPLVNTHMGITPKYRGVHGGYWAMAEDDRENCGVTVHQIDTGIDTGAVICQGRIEVTKDDNFVTYPYLQMAVGADLMVEAINSYIREGRFVEVNNGLPSKIWSHPTLVQYLRNRRRGAK